MPSRLVLELLASFALEVCALLWCERTMHGRGCAWPAVGRRQRRRGWSRGFRMVETFTLSVANVC
jgi:hypothetical protein